MEARLRASAITEAALCRIASALCAGGCRQDGAFQVYRGIPPESTFYRVKQYLLRLEGVFRLLPPDLNTEKR